MDFNWPELKEEKIEKFNKNCDKENLENPDENKTELVDNLSPINGSSNSNYLLTNNEENLTETEEENETELVDNLSTIKESSNLINSSTNRSIHYQSSSENSPKIERQKLRRRSLHGDVSEGSSTEYFLQKKTPSNISLSYQETSSFSYNTSFHKKFSSPQKSSYVKNKSNIKNSHISYQIFYKIIFILLLIPLVIYFIFISSLTEQKSNQLKTIEVDEVFLKLRSSFPKQSDFFWNVLNALIGSLLSNENYNGPATFLLAVEPGAETTVVCFVQQLSTKLKSILNSSFDILINIDASAYRKDEMAKVLIHNQIEKDFKKGKLIAVVNHVESLKADDIMIFHGLCDTVSAKFKKTIYFLLYHISEPIPPFDLQSKLRNQMHQKWVMELGEDAFASLLTRISSFVLPFTVEENFQCTSK